MTDRKSLVLAPLPGCEPEIGRWLRAMEDVRHSLKSKLEGTSQRLLDWKMDGRESIGNLLYHIAFVEADWLYVDILQSEWAPGIRALFPYEERNTQGSLTQVQGESLETHLHRLDQVRAAFLSHLRPMDLPDWRQPRVLEKYDVTPEWVVYHLIEHESHH
ncbi:MULTISPECIES: DinB family protein [Paenibacillus]|uniref:DinB family protein n=1 Tax=Paenibacillus TaxID=44249 RepID=UPI0022B8D43A|nr:DinB family protein [Paenibacillus caseinilyticus]MCZ8520324.1 DinB family protein [Paenibacillus caseinilyticus]